MPLDPDAVRLLDFMRLSGARPVETLDVAAARTAYRASCRMLSGAPPAIAAIETLDGAVPLRLYRPLAAGSRAALLYFHGGGWVIGDLDTHDAVCRHLAALASLVVIAADYRRAPEAPFPAALEDGEAAFLRITGEAAALGIDARRIAVGGDSAGGNLAAALSLVLRARGGPMPAFQLLFYPATDLTCSLPSHATFARQPPLTASAITWFCDHYAPSPVDRGDWRLSPLLAASHEGLPPAHVVVADHDPLLDEGAAYVKRLRRARVPASLRIARGQLHGFLTMGRLIEAVDSELRDAARRLAEGLHQ